MHPDAPALRQSSSQTFGPIPMWDSADPARAPAPLPLNPHPTSPVLRPMGSDSRNVSPVRAGQQSPTRNPVTPSKAIHRRMTAFQTPNLSSGSGSGNSTSLTKQSAHPGNIFKDGGYGFNPPPPKKEHEEPEKNRDFSIPAPLLPALRPMKDIEPLNLSRYNIPGPTTPPTVAPAPAVTSQVLSRMSAPHLPAHGHGLSPSMQSDRLTSAINSGDFQILAGQLTNLLNISTNLQKEMANLSRRSKDNATDLLSLKEATNARDEDIRDSLKDLVSGLGSDYGPSRGRLAITAGDREPDYSSALSKYGPPDIHRNFLADAEEILREGGQRRKSVTRETQNTATLEKIVRDMASKDSQTKILDSLDDIQSELLGQGKDVTGGLQDIIKTLRAMPLNGSSGVVIPYGGSPTAEERDEEILAFLRALKEGVSEQVRDVHSSLGAINTGTASKLDHLQTTIIKIDQTADDHYQQGEDLKVLLQSFQDDLHDKERMVGDRMKVVLDSVNAVAEVVNVLPREGSVSTGSGNSNSGDVKALVQSLIEELNAREQGTERTLDSILREISKIPAAFPIASRELSVVAPDQLAGHANIDILLPIINDIKHGLLNVQEEVAGREKVTEKAMEIILRETSRITPAIDAKLAQINGQDPTVVATHVEAQLKQEFQNICSGFSGIEKTVDKAVRTIVQEMENIKVVNTPTALVRTGETTRESGHHFDGSVAAVSAIGAMGKDLKHTMENLQSDVNGREEVTAKALEIILREIGTINKAVSLVPAKVTESSNANSQFGQDVKEVLAGLQQDIMGREKHTEKAMEIILREVAAGTTAVAALKAVHEASVNTGPSSHEKETKFSLETLIGRSSRTADTTSSILELLETFHTSSTGTTQATYLLLQALDKAIREPVTASHTLINTLQEQFHSANSNTGKSLVEVAKFLDELGATTAATASKTETVKGAIDLAHQGVKGAIDVAHQDVKGAIDIVHQDVKSKLDLVHQDVQGFNGEVEKHNVALLQKLEEVRKEVEESSSKALAIIPEHPELAILDEIKKQQTSSIQDIQALVASVAAGFGELTTSQQLSVKEVLTRLDGQGETHKAESIETQDALRSLKESVSNIGGDGGALAKMLTNIQEIGTSLSTLETLTTSNVDTMTKSNNTAALMTQLEELSAGLKTLEESASTKSSTTALMTQLEELSAGLKTIEESVSTNHYDDTEVKTKLESLLNHSTHQAKFFSQMSLVEDMQKQLQETSGKVSTFIEAQSSLLEANAANERHAAAEATLTLERAISEKAVVEATTSSLRAEEMTLRSVVTTLHEENTTLQQQKQHLRAELSGMETALAMRREELFLLESRAEVLERRVVEGVINQSRSLLLAKSNKGANGPLKRIPNPPASGTIRSKKLGTGGRRILSLSQMNHVQPVVPDIHVGRTPSSGSNISQVPLLNHPGGRASFGGMPLKRAHSVKTGAAEAMRKASWQIGGPLPPSLINDDKENSPSRLDSLEEVCPGKEDEADEMKPEESEMTQEPLEDPTFEGDEEPAEEGTLVLAGSGRKRPKEYPALMGADDLDEGRESIGTTVIRSRVPSGMSEDVE